MSVTYIIFGILWFYFSDNIPYFASDDSFQAIKGTLYVCVTGIIFWIFLLRIERKNQKILLNLENSLKENRESGRLLKEERNLLRTVIDNVPDYIFVKDINGKLLIANNALVNLTGSVTEEDLLGKQSEDFLSDSVAKMAAKKEDQLISRQAEVVEQEFVAKGANGKMARMSSTKVPLFNPEGKIVGIVGISRDVTKIYNEAKTDELVLKIITALNKDDDFKDVLAESLQLIGNHFAFKFAEAWLVSPDNDEVMIAATWSSDPASRFHVEHQQSYRAGEGLAGFTLSTKDILIWNDVMNHPEFTRKERSQNENLHTGIGIPLLRRETVIAVFTFLSEEEFYDFDDVKMVLEHISTQIVLHLERKKHENELEESNNRTTNLLESIRDGFFAVDANWTVSYWNSEAERILNMPRDVIVGQKLYKLYPEHDPAHLQYYINYRKVMQEKEPLVFEEYYESLKVWLELNVYPSKDGISVFFRDVTENRNLRDELDKHVDELAISNAELEQFAYVASHDMQEPLRMVTGFLTQLEKKYKDQLDEKAQQYIHFAVDGAKRMRTIILDLLEYSKVGKKEYQPERIEVDKLITDITLLNQSLIIENNVEIKSGDLPQIFGGKTLIHQVFQNLISNAIKYRKPDIDPQVTITCEDEGDFWKFAVQDNGIGIQKDYFERIFILFQRLHIKEDYSGTGIGLAICKKIIESHSGRIWVESEEGNGSTFYFTIKK